MKTKSNKKKVFVTALCVCLIAILSFGTLAWFTSEDSVTNKFKVASLDEDADDIFSVDIRERVDTDGDGNPDTTLDVGDVAEGGYTYENILPGDNLYKEPIVVNTGSYDEYIRVKVTIDNASEWVDIVENYDLELEDIFVGYDDELWTRNSDETVKDENEDTLTYVYYLNDVLVPDNDAEEGRVSLFTGVKIPEEITQDDMAGFKDGIFTLKIVAEAVQTENVGDSAIEAFKTVEETAE